MQSNRDYHVESLARGVCALTANRGACEGCGFYSDKDCHPFRTANLLYNRGARQIEDPVKGKWIPQQALNGIIYSCSFCNDKELHRLKQCRGCHSMMETEIEI